MWLPLTITAGTPRRAASSASAGVGRTPQSTATRPSASIAAAQAAAIRGELGRRSRPTSTASKPSVAARWRRKAATCAAQTASVISLTRPRRPLVPNFTRKLPLSGGRSRPRSGRCRPPRGRPRSAPRRSRRGFARGSPGDGYSRAAGRSNSFSRTSTTSASRVTCAVPRTTIQCSARWWCFCSEKRLPGSTTIRLTRKRGPRSTVWNQPHGRCTRAGVAASAKPRAASPATSPFTSCARSIGATRTASAVSTTARPDTPSTQRSRPSERR